MGTARKNRLWNQIICLFEKNNISINDDILEDVITSIQDKYIYEGIDIEDSVNVYITNMKNITSFIKEFNSENDQFTVVVNENVKEEMMQEVQDALDKKAFGEKMKQAREAKKLNKQSNKV